MLKKLVGLYVDWRYPAQTSEEIRDEILREHDQMADGVVRRFSRGNVNLKAGRFVSTSNPRLKSHKVAQ